MTFGQRVMLHWNNFITTDRPGCLRWLALAVLALAWAVWPRSVAEPERVPCPECAGTGVIEDVWVEARLITTYECPVCHGAKTVEKRKEVTLE